MNLIPLWVLLFLGITFGLFVALIGATLFFATRDRRAAATVLVVGLMLLIGTVAFYMFS
jgi:hypothetical protein